MREGAHRGLCAGVEEGGAVDPGEGIEAPWRSPRPVGPWPEAPCRARPRGPRRRARSPARDRTGRRRSHAEIAVLAAVGVPDPRPLAASAGDLVDQLLPFGTEAGQVAARRQHRAVLRGQALRLAGLRHIARHQGLEVAALPLGHLGGGRPRPARTVGRGGRPVEVPDAGPLDARRGRRPAPRRAVRAVGRALELGGDAGEGGLAGGAQRDRHGGSRRHRRHRPGKTLRRGVGHHVGRQAVERRRGLVEEAAQLDVHPHLAADELAGLDQHDRVEAEAEQVLVDVEIRRSHAANAGEHLQQPGEDRLFRVVRRGRRDRR